MSTSLFHNLIKLTKNIMPREVQLVLSGVSLGGHALYSYTTYKVDNITINKKYTYTQNANTQFMIIDKNDKHFNINNSLWYWKWDSIEDWNTLKDNDSIQIKYYGYRIPFLGIFPNVICSKNEVPENNNNNNNNYGMHTKKFVIM